MFSLREAVDAADLPPFVFEDVDGKERSLPHAQMLTPRQALAVLDGELGEVLHDIAPDVADMLLDLPAHAMDSLVREWMTHSGVELDGQGKSSKPSRSASTTGTRSRRTSRSAGSTRKR